jgi:sugar lactone lactonase YvrE
VTAKPAPEVFSDTVCRLGEGPLWHPERQQLFWFDILSRRLLTREDGAERHWDFDTTVSAAGWIDATTLLVASATALLRFDIETGAHEEVAPLEGDNPATRSNDGRTDPWGGFWIGTMGVGAEPGAGAIYRYHRGEVRRLHGGITIPNAICFDPDGGFALFADSADGRILRQRLASADGWPEGAPEVWLDVSAEDFEPDGAVIDVEGHVWNAQWGASRVARYTLDGQLVDVFPVPAVQASCPAFGGPDLSTLFVTTAAEGREDDQAAGRTYVMETGVRGQAEHQVIL